MEWYSATHSERVDELLQWPARKFEAFYKAAQKRSFIEEITKRKDSMIDSLWANSNYDKQKEGEDAPRDEAIKNIEERHQEVLDALNGVGPVEEEIDKGNPFFSAMERGKSKWDGSIQMPTSEELERQAEYRKDIDQ